MSGNKIRPQPRQNNKYKFRDDNIPSETQQDKKLELLDKDNPLGSRQDKLELRDKNNPSHSRRNNKLELNTNEIGDYEKELRDNDIPTDSRPDEFRNDNNPSDDWDQDYKYEFRDLDTWPGRV